MLTVYQYEITEPKERQKSTHYTEVSATIQEAKKKGLEAYEISMKFAKDGVELVSCKNITEEL